MTSETSGNAAHAVALALAADHVVVVRGGVQGTESVDRTKITLDDKHDNMDATIAALKAAKLAPSKMTLAVVTGETVALEEYTGDYASILFAIEGGQAAGTGLAEVLFGDVSPSGMLPFTMYVDGLCPTECCCLLQRLLSVLSPTNPMSSPTPSALCMHTYMNTYVQV